MKAIKNFNDDKLSFEEKNELVDDCDTKKIAVQIELDELLEIQTIQEIDIDRAINVMGSVNLQWEALSPENRKRFQSMIFPDGLVYDYEQHRFGTSQISPLYRYIPTKKDSELPSKSFLVAGAGFEPAT